MSAKKTKTTPIAVPPAEGWKWMAASSSLLLALYALCLAHKIELVPADVGRHIKNGEEFFRTLTVVSTNYYSYTYPDFPVVNHHWAAGAVFYVLWRVAGFEGVQLFSI